MPQIALYRKYRPKTFKEVRGQDHIIKVLEGSIKKGTIAHAYLFAGSRGTGKTSVARIFANEIGCKPSDLYELDAASNRGIDEIREIREGVHTLPYESLYKVYILDEAHMLTDAAWNALLKTLEEPPLHVIFILATTEIDKVPETITSRCQVFTFKKPSSAVLKEVVINIAKAEGFTLDGAAADLAVLLGEGSFRDTIGSIQKIIASSSDKKISLEEVELITGAPKGALLNSLLEKVEKKDLNEALLILKKAGEENIDMRIFLKLLIERVRSILLLRFAKDLEKDIENSYTEADFKFLKERASDTKSIINSQFLLEILKAYELVGVANVPTLPLELALMKFINNS